MSSPRSKKPSLDVSGRAQRTPPSVALAPEPAGPDRVRGPAPAGYGGAGHGRRKARRGRIERAVEWFDGNDHGD
jgi:hypothetical protein